MADAWWALALTATARHDLDHLHHRGLIDRIETPGRRYYQKRTTA